jgi:4-alpha-glucanotransferase
VVTESELARAAGIESGYRDMKKRWHPAPPETVSALLQAMDVRPGWTPPQSAPREAAAPVSCYLPRDLRAWGWSVQLYALRSRASWGIGDLGDLRRLAAWSRQTSDAGMVLVNPLHAPLPLLPLEPSPYYPSSRRFRNPLYIRVEEVPGWSDAAAELEPLARAGQELNRHRHIDRDRVLELKLRALERLWAAFPGSEDFDRYRDEGGRSLADYSTFCAIAEAEGAPWPLWPAPLRHPRNEAVAGFAHKAPERVGFHAWLQWLLDEQLGQAGRELGLVADLAIGVDPAGADAWAEQDLLLPGFTIGAPPDTFNRAGQNWQLAAFDPWRMRAGGHSPLREVLRAGFRHAAGLRMDHVMGLWRLYLIPHGAGADQGAYLAQGAAEALDLLAAESRRAQAFVVGEDLGTVERLVRRELTRRNILGYRLLWFERRRPESYPARSLASVSTHDLPTLPGAWSGADGEAIFRSRLQRVAGLADNAPLERAVESAYAALAASASMLVGASLEDALSVVERPNLPGTTAGERRNWSLALPLTLEEIEADPRPAALARVLERRPPPGGQP